MDLFDKIENASNTALAYEKHPVRDLDLEFRFQYLNGLGLLMNVDGDIDDEEKLYIKRLLHAFDLPDERLDEMIAFSQNPDQIAIRDMMSALSQSEELKYVFLLDCLSMVSENNKIKKVESETLAVYCKSINISQDEFESLKELEAIIRKKDHIALYRFFLPKRKYDVNVFEYLLEYYQLDVEHGKDQELERLKKLQVYNFSMTSIPMSYSEQMLADTEERIIRISRIRHWRSNSDKSYKEEIKRARKERLKDAFSWAVEKGGDSKGQLEIRVSKKPVMLFQACAFLQDYYDQKFILEKGDFLVDSNTGQIVVNLKHCGVSLANGLLMHSADEYAIGLSPYGIEMFVNWVNGILDYNVSELSFSNLPVDGEGITLEAKGFQFHKQEYCKGNGKAYCVKFEADEDNSFCFKKIKSLSEKYTDNKTVFRIMKL